MYIQKLILTPMSKGYFTIVRHNPNPEIASTLIKERLSMEKPAQKVPGIMKRIPASIRSWVNTKCLITKK